MCDKFTTVENALVEACVIQFYRPNSENATAFFGFVQAVIVSHRSLYKRSISFIAMLSFNPNDV